MEEKGRKKGIEKMMRERREFVRKSSQALGMYESVLRFGVSVSFGLTPFL